MRKKKSLLLVLLPIIIVAVWLLASFGGQMSGRPIRAQYGAPPPDIRDSQIVRFYFGQRVFPFLSSSQENEMLRFYEMYAEAHKEFEVIGVGDRKKWIANRLGELLSKIQEQERLIVMEELAKRFPVQGAEKSTVQRLIWREAKKFTELNRIYQEEAAAGRLAAARARWLGKCGRSVIKETANLAKLIFFIDPIYRDADERLLIALDTAYNAAYPGKHSLVGEYLSLWLAKNLPADVEPTMIYQLDLLLTGGTPSISKVMDWEQFQAFLKDLGARGKLPLKERKEFWTALEKDWYYITLQYPEKEMKEWMIDYLNALGDDIRFLERG